MKVAIPVESKNGLTSKVYGHFGSSPYFAIYETEQGSVDFMANNHEEHEHGSCQPTAELSAGGVNAIVCGGMGFRAVNRFKELGIKVYFGENASTLDDVVLKWKNNEIKEFQIENACQGHQ